MMSHFMNAWENYVDDICPHLGSLTLEEIKDNKEYQLFCRAYDRSRSRSSSTKISRNAQSSRDFAKRYGMRALTGSTAKSKSYGEHLRREVIEQIPEEDRIGLRCLTRAKDFITMRGEIEYFREIAAEHAEIIRAQEP